MVWFPGVGWRGGGVDRRWNKVLPPSPPPFEGSEAMCGAMLRCCHCRLHGRRWRPNVRLLLLQHLLEAARAFGDWVPRYSQCFRCGPIGFQPLARTTFQEFPFFDFGGRCLGFGMSEELGFELATGRTETTPELEGFCTLVLVLLYISFLVWGVV
jgi:hypothetical protein